jgi:hypothetical protein
VKLDCRIEGGVQRVDLAFNEEEKQRALDFMDPATRAFCLGLLGSARLLKRAQGCLEIVQALENQRIMNKLAVRA